ncbi:MAG: helix-turn-helix domain-containing protein [Sulfuritalea sp.]|nr:helix-turn-helix domain-containing protein [Sulfuritalea sp.]
MRLKFNFLFMEEKVEFSQRLRKAMQQAGYPLRPIVLEREFNTRYWGRSVTVQAVRRWLRGEAIPSQEKLQVLAEWLNVEPQVLRFGEGVTKSVRAKRERWDEGIGYQEREVFEAFLSLTAPQRKAVREVILGLVQARKGAPKE